MTTTLDQPTASDAHPASSPLRPLTGTVRRVELRLAVRQTLRAWPVSLLVIVLVALPMALLSGAAVFIDSRTATPSERITSELGQTAAWYSIVGGADPSRSQGLDDPTWYDVDRHQDGTPRNPELPPPPDLSGLVDDPDLLRVTTVDVTAVTAGGTGLLRASIGEADDPRLEGRYELLDGERSASERDALVSPGALTRLGAQIGDELTLVDPAVSFRIVGVMKAATAPDDEQAVFLPAAALPVDQADPLRTLWFAPQEQPTAAQIDELNRAGVVVFARDLVEKGDAAGYVDPSAAWTYTAAMLIVGGFTAYLVILLAGAGFAVSAKRQERSLAIAASVGAGRGNVFRIVLLQGTVLGLIGGIVGVAVGIALALPVLRLFDDGAAASIWGFHVPWIGLVLLVFFAAAIGTASALLPARAATRGDVLSSLRGSRKPAVVRVGRPFWGSLVIIVGLAATAAGGLGLAALNAADLVDYTNPLRTVCVAGIVAGPLLFQIGAILAGRWLLSLIARAATRLGLSPRIAARDAAAHPSRIVPAFAAIAACVFIASFALTAVAVYTTQQARNWTYQAPVGSVVISIWADEDSPATTAAMDALEQTEPAEIGVVRVDEDKFVSGTADSRSGELVYPELFSYTDCADVESGACVMLADALFNSWSAAVVDPSDLETVLGVPVDAATRTAFADGGALVLPAPFGDGDYLDGDAVVLHTWDPAVVDAFWEGYGKGESKSPDPLRTTRVPAQAIDVDHPLPWPVILSPAAADAVGFLSEPGYLVGSYTTPPAQQRLDALAAAAGQQWADDGGFTYAIENGPPSPEAWLWLILGTAGILVLGAGGVALGLARIERRPDDATLTAVGASPGIRRRISFWQALIIVGIGSVIGTVAGVIPMWGIVMMSQSDAQWALRLADTPWPWLALLAAGLPLTIAAASWLISARRPDLTHRTAIT